MTAGASPRDPTGVLDAAALGRLADLDPSGSGALVQRVLSTYATALERTRGELRQARQPVAPEALRQLAHTLKSSSASVGALALSTLCAQVEQHVRSQQAGDLELLLNAMEDEMQRVAGAVQAMLRP
jgi:HPt (histidine-containing phosphotransfer) domain-containing protein